MVVQYLFTDVLLITHWPLYLSAKRYNYDSTERLANTGFDGDLRTTADDTLGEVDAGIMRFNKVSVA